jgi:hypothetical protein
MGTGGGATGTTLGGRVVVVVVSTTVVVVSTTVVVVSAIVVVVGASVLVGASVAGAVGAIVTASVTGASGTVAGGASSASSSPGPVTDVVAHVASVRSVAPITRGITTRTRTGSQPSPDLGDLLGIRAGDPRCHRTEMSVNVMG